MTMVMVMMMMTMMMTTMMMMMMIMMMMMMVMMMMMMMMMIMNFPSRVGKSRFIPRVSLLCNFVPIFISAVIESKIRSCSKEIKKKNIRNE